MDKHNVEVRLGNHHAVVAENVDATRAAFLVRHYKNKGYDARVAPIHSGQRKRIHDDLVAKILGNPKQWKGKETLNRLLAHGHNALTFNLCKCRNKE